MRTISAGPAVVVGADDVDVGGRDVGGSVLIAVMAIEEVSFKRIVKGRHPAELRPGGV
jgi:hypothetical protein